MKIVTVNVPESHIEAIKKLIGKDGLYPSRSELVRVAVRDWLLKQIKLTENRIKYKEVEPEAFDDKNFVRVPITEKDKNNEPIREFRTYKILKRLEH